MGDEAVPPQPANRAVYPAYWINVALLLALAAGTSLWLYYYTDRFPQVAGLLASGGALGWLGVVLKALLGNRSEAFKSWTESKLLNSTGLTFAFSFIAFALVVLGNFRGGLQLEPLQEPMEHTVQIHGVGKQEEKLLRLPAAGTLRWTGWTNWRCPSQVQIKVSGYPERRFSFEPWQRYEVYVPDSLVRPVVLLWPSPDLIDSVRDTKSTLQIVVKQGNQTFTREADFDGHAIWIGGASDLAIPDKLEQAWNGMNTKRLNFWLSPSAPPQFDLELEPGQEIMVRVPLANEKNALATTTIKVKPLRTSHDFVQEEELNVLPSP